MPGFQRLVICIGIASWSTCHGLLVTRATFPPIEANMDTHEQGKTIRHLQALNTKHRNGLKDEYADEFYEESDLDGNPNDAPQFIYVSREQWNAENMTGLPTFYVDEDTRRSVGWRKTLLTVLENHTLRVKTKEEATLIFLGDNEPWSNISELPRLPAGRAYVTYIKLNYPRGGALLQMLKDRKDILFVAHDLTETGPWSGSTIAHIAYWHGPAPNMSDVYLPKTYNWTLAFQGMNNNALVRAPKTRQLLKDAVASATANHTMPDNVYINVASGRRDYNFFDLVQNSAFHLVPRGDRPWSNRFLEVVGGCSIPAVLCDNLDLPYSEIIDWSEASVKLSEAKFIGNVNRGDPMALKDLVDELPRDPKKIQRMREKVCEINEKYFATPVKRAQAMLLSLSKHL